MAQILMKDIMSLLNSTKIGRERLRSPGPVPPIYISFGTKPKDVEILTEEFVTPDGIGNMFVDVGSDNVVYGIEFIA